MRKFLSFLMLLLVIFVISSNVSAEKIHITGNLIFFENAQGQVNDIMLKIDPSSNFKPEKDSISEDYFMSPIFFCGWREKKSSKICYEWR